MKYRNFVEFSDYLHSKKDIFESPKLQDTEWQYMLSQAKEKSGFRIKRENKSMTKIHMSNIIFSPRLAAVLLVTLFTIMFVSYMASNSQNTDKINTARRSLQYKDKNTLMPTQNVSYGKLDDGI